MPLQIYVREVWDYSKANIENMKKATSIDGQVELLNEIKHFLKLHPQQKN